MRNPFIIITKLIKKGFALILLSALTIFSCIFNILFFFYRFVAVGCAVIGTLVTVVDSFMYGFTAQRGLDLLFLVFMVALRYLLPLLAPVLQRWQEELKTYVYAPLFIRPPVRYTI